MSSLYQEFGFDLGSAGFGDDAVWGGEGDDTLYGGAGADEFRFADASGGSVGERLQALGIDTVQDYSAADADTFGLSDATFGLGNSGNLTHGTNYFEQTAFTLDGTPVDVSGGAANAGIVILGQNTGTEGVAVYYTEDASAMTNANSYQIADVIGVNMSDVEAADFFLRS